jgi:DNA-binding response OmpR family regulator
MAPASILLIEGQTTGGNSFGPVLKEKGFRVLVVHSGREALQKFRSERPGLIILDASSMRSSGTRIVRALRQKDRDISIVLICSSADAAEKLDVDVTLAQPFTARKLLNHVTRLAPNERDEELIVGNLRLNLEQRCVRTSRHERHLLTPKQVRLLETFMRHPGETLSRGYLIKHVWDTDYLGDTRILDVHIRWVREIIEEDPGKPHILITVRGVGYRFNAPGR